jgi:hypothetical protein
MHRYIEFRLIGGIFGKLETKTKQAPLGVEGVGRLTGDCVEGDLPLAIGYGEAFRVAAPSSSIATCVQPFPRLPCSKIFLARLPF